MDNAVILSDREIEVLRKGNIHDIEGKVIGIVLKQVARLKTEPLLPNGATPFIVQNTDYAVLCEAIIHFKKELSNYSDKDFERSICSKQYIETAIENLIKTFKVPIEQSTERKDNNQTS